MVVLTGGVWLLAIPYSPKPILETGTVIHLYRAMGMVPEANEITVSKEIGHDVFEVPEQDEVELKKARETMGMAMGTEAMPGMDMKKDEDHAGEEKEAMPGMAMKKEEAEDHAGEGKEKMPMKEGMAMKEEAEEAGHGEEKEEAEHGAEEEEEEGGHGGGSEAGGMLVLVQGSAAEVDAEIAKDGIEISSNEVIDMKEWSVGGGMTMVQAGQTIRLTVRNSGNIPHEFMLMDGAAMQAVGYRLNRPDWNLTEHEATMEIPFLMPGDSQDVVIKITKSGMWMYMCMFPYHMQLGMMGMLMTPDMMGQGMGGMGGMGGMKM
ncbi:MAG: multicopper oxidase domain-containing protein [Alphaproteobacteria bacterium]